MATTADIPRLEMLQVADMVAREKLEGSVEATSSPPR